jgi:hypothetical protein
VSETPPPALPVASFKLQLAERRARIVPARDAAGCPFAGPGVDLVGEETAAPFVLVAPILVLLAAREPVRVRSLSFDVARRRLLVTVEAPTEGGPRAPEGRPRVVRIDPAVDGSAGDELLALARPLLDHLGAIAAVKLAARARAIRDA